MPAALILQPWSDERSPSKKTLPSVRNFAFRTLVSSLMRALALLLAILPLSLGEAGCSFGGARGHEVYFVRDIAPALTTRGCNQARCHGAPGGKGGFQLSLFGADPETDYEEIVRSADGRRVDRRDPSRSLVLEKATARIPHEGGRGLRTSDSDYAALRDWIRAGAPWGEGPRLLSVTIAPAELTLGKGQSRRLSATAHFADGSTRDLTNQASYLSTDPRVATVDGEGRVTVHGFGEAAIVASYQRLSAIARVLDPQPLPALLPRPLAHNHVDELVFARLDKLGIPPSEIAADEVFLRRVYLDVIGTLPTADEARAFAADTAPNKRDRVIDRLLGREEFADWWALKWGDLLRIKSEFPVRVWPKGAQTYYRWLRRSLLDNRPYDQLVRELLTATGSDFRDGPANFFRANPSKDPQTFAETSALVFMGMRLGCARCHGHPTERWNPEDDLGLAAFFGKVAFKPTREWKEEIVYLNHKGVFRDPQTKMIVKPRFLDGRELDPDERDDPRTAFCVWLTSPENPYFARNIVNRIWAWLFGRGFVHEPDDLRPSNPPSQPELLDWLAADFIQHKYDLRYLFRLILSSATYQLSSRSNQWNAGDERYFSHHALRRLGAEQLLDAIDQVTETSETFESPIPAPATRLPAGYRVEQLYDGDITAPFLELFGRPSRDTPYESEREAALSSRQLLHLLNSEHVQGKVDKSPLVARLVKARAGGKMTNEGIVEAIYLAALSRRPSPEEQKKLVVTLAEAGKRPEEAIEDLLWAVLNTAEFLFNH